ncbi:uncharacterized protein LOC103867673 [Brassica rapa]|uniref:BnaA05g11100D protein n=4 Tax=Brassica TaxID=3705 RepID=A0A078HWI1_BRANA|nr:uncharacterized protein LOC103867673 [Brassica rapa]XP_013752383.1 uncharacterized protein BNAA05G11100D [Brassica napus]KAF3555351.1 hypothetical protein F2Q69_00011544 [Brassica cretica]KAH0925634.1 hypothetical protein HID58_017890 [Brassica napus]CAF2096277.1 unnamed protein product [Brassica napus]CAG7874880.1 unnamed protein product [Brassica rapa]CDY42076.1 BnaA05g11100D [Brassica napus]
MGSEVVNPIKPRFDLSMSRRTRKPWSSSLVNEMQHQVLSTQSSQQEKELEQDEDREIDRKSLNNLMRSEQESNGEANVSNKNSLGQHFGDDEAIKQTMQVVVKKQGGENGVKFKGMMSRYVKVLSGLMKAKRDRKTSALRFKT